MNAHDPEQKDLIFGIRPVLEAIKSGKEINKILVQQGLSGDLYHELRRALKGNEGLLQTVPMQKMQRITRKNHQGIIAFISPVEYTRLDQLLPVLYEQGETPALIMLDRVTDVRNFGAIARSAACTGFQGLIVPAKGSALVTADAVKTSAGALMNLPVCRENNLTATLRYLKESGIKVIACSEKASEPYWSEDYSVPVALLMGSEEDGIAPELLQRADALVQIPMTASNRGVASLNVSVAAGIVMMETLKQRLQNQE